MTASKSRFELLDAFRGLADLSVLGFHIINNLVPRGTGAVSDLLWLGWTGVYLFFPISTAGVAA